MCRRNCNSNTPSTRFGIHGQVISRKRRRPMSPISSSHQASCPDRRPLKKELPFSSGSAAVDRSPAKPRWTINGEKGEIRLTAEGGTTLHADAHAASVVIEVHDLQTNEVSRVDWQWQPWQLELPISARSTGMLYEAFAEPGNLQYPTFDDALVRHKQLDAMLSKWGGK
jgi:hypothetical protein